MEASLLHIMDIFSANVDQYAQYIGAQADLHLSCIWYNT